MGAAGLILAAGRGTRFGSDKRQALLPGGVSMLESVLAAHAQVFDALWLVVPPGDKFAPPLAQAYSASLLVNEQADQGMGGSLACAARALLQQPGISGVIVSLADMPAVSAATLARLREALIEHAQPVVPLYQGQAGHPRGLPRACFQALSGLHGDQGARHLLDWRRQAVAVPVTDPGVLLDVDTPADLATLPHLG